MFGSSSADRLINKVVKAIKENQEEKDDINTHPTREDWARTGQRNRQCETNKEQAD